MPVKVLGQGGYGGGFQVSRGGSSDEPGTSVGFNYDPHAEEERKAGIDLARAQAESFRANTPENQSRVRMEEADKVFAKRRAAGDQAMGAEMPSEKITPTQRIWRILELGTYSYLHARALEERTRKEQFKGLVSGVAGADPNVMGPPAEGVSPWRTGLENPDYWKAVKETESMLGPTVTAPNFNPMDPTNNNFVTSPYNGVKGIRTIPTMTGGAFGGLPAIPDMIERIQGPDPYPDKSSMALAHEAQLLVAQREQAAQNTMYTFGTLAGWAAFLGQMMKVYDEAYNMVRNSKMSQLRPPTTQPAEQSNVR